MMFIALFAAASNAHAAQPKADGNTLVTPTIFAEAAELKSGATFQVAVNFKIEKGWHLYWLNPGDAGQPPTVKWTLPEGITVGEPQFPTPFDLTKGDIKTYGYENEMTLLFDVTVAEDFKGNSAELKADVKWLVCEKICLPGKASLKVTIGGDDLPAPDERMAAWRAALPRKAHPQAHAATPDGGTLAIDWATGTMTGQFTPGYANVVSWIPPATDGFEIAEPSRMADRRAKPYSTERVKATVNLLSKEAAPETTLDSILILETTDKGRYGLVVPITVPAREAAK